MPECDYSVCLMHGINGRVRGTDSPSLSSQIRSKEKKKEKSVRESLEFFLSPRFCCVMRAQNCPDKKRRIVLK